MLFGGSIGLVTVGRIRATIENFKKKSNRTVTLNSEFSKRKPQTFENKVRITRLMSQIISHKK